MKIDTPLHPSALRSISQANPWAYFADIACRGPLVLRCIGIRNSPTFSGGRSMPRFPRERMTPSASCRISSKWAKPWGIYAKGLTKQQKHQSRAF